MALLNKSAVAAALIFAALALSGCATVSTLDAAKADAPLVYAGTRLNLYQMEGGCCAQQRFGTQGPRYPVLDLPGSFLLDTLLLPISLATAMGASVSVRGGR